MKKRLLFILMLFVSLTGFKTGKVEITGGQDVTRGLFSSGMELPKITKVAPNKEGDVRVFEGQISKFYIEFEANPAASIEITKNGNPWKTSGDLTATGRKVEVTLENVTQADAGIYVIILTNKAGSVRQTFTVQVFEDPGR